MRLLSLLNWAEFEVLALGIDQMNMPERLITGDAQGLSGQIIVTPNPNLLFDTVAQINSDREQMTVQSRLRYRYRAGSDFYLVYRWPGELGSTNQVMSQANPEQGLPDEWRITLKLNWRFDFLL